MSSNTQWSLGSQPMIPGNVADADLVLLSDGKARLYFQNSSVEGASTPFVSIVYSAITTDGGKTWSLEPGTRLEGVSGIEVTTLRTGGFKAYFQVDQQSIGSASSSDGVTWQRDAGFRIRDDDLERPALDRVGFPTVAQLSDNSWVMVYEGKFNGVYAGNARPGADQTMMLYWATSTDGMSWTKRGVAVDSRNDLFKGEVQHGRLLQNQDGSWDLYFWASSAITPPGEPYVNNTGIYKVALLDSGFSTDVTRVLAGQSLIVPSDPALGLWQGVINLYYGIGPNQAKAQGIYQAVGQTSDTNATLSRSQLWVGTSATDDFSGGAGWNSFNGYGGNDIYRGGSQTDEVVFNGKRSNYALVNHGASLQVTDTTGSDGVDTLLSIERLKFSDVSIALDTGKEQVAGQAYRIYKAAFNRDPMQGDKDGLGYWIAQMDSGMDIIEVSARFIDSVEFRSLYGTNPTNADFLTRVYQNVLGRVPDQSGYEWWLNEMNTNPEKTKAKVLADFAESTENQDGVIALIGGGIVYDPWGP